MKNPEKPSNPENISKNDQKEIIEKIDKNEDISAVMKPAKKKIFNPNNYSVDILANRIKDIKPIDNDNMRYDRGRGIKYMYETSDVANTLVFKGNIGNTTNNNGAEYYNRLKEALNYKKNIEIDKKDLNFMGFPSYYQRDK